MRFSSSCSPLFNLAQKIVDQLFRTLEAVSLLAIPLMAVISLRPLIVVAEQTLAGTPIEQPIFEWMTASLDRHGKPPNHDLKDFASVKIQPVL